MVSWIAAGVAGVMVALILARALGIQQLPTYTTDLIGACVFVLLAFACKFLAHRFDPASG